MTPKRPPYRLGTRASPLAIAQANMTRAALIAAHGWSDDAIEIIAVTTEGDRILDRPLAEIGGKALWTKTLDAKLLAGEIDFAVHSMKDVETIRPADIALAAILERADPHDRLIGGNSLESLAAGTRVGTSSPRRAAQVLRLRPDVQIVGFRGNVATRLNKLKTGEADATLLAAAGLDRLGSGHVGIALPIDIMLPAASQGAVGIEVRTTDSKMLSLLSAIDHAPTRVAVEAERALLAGLNADCHSPVGAHAHWEEGALVLTAEILSGDGQLHVRDSIAVGSVQDARALAQNLLSRATPELRALFGA
jgi:hydroxymethylbilane synthase